MAQTQSTAGSQESQTNIYPNSNQIAGWQNIDATAGGLAQWWINNPAPQASVAGPSDLTQSYWQNAGGATTAAPNMNPYTGAMTGIAGAMNNQMAPTSFNITPGQVNLPNTYANGTPQITAPGGVSGLASSYQYNPQQVSGPTVSATQVQAPTNMVNPITGLAQVQGPTLQQYQMGPAQQVTAPSLSQFQMQAAAPIAASQVSAPQSWTDPGTAAQYMSPYTQQVVNAQLAQAQVQNQQQINAIQANAAQSGAFGGSREAIEEANQNLGYQQMAATLEAQGLQSAYQQGQGQFNTQQQMTMQQQQANQQAGLAAAQANQAAQQQANVQNLSSYLQTQGLGAQTGLQSALANQQAGLTVGSQNLAAQLQTQGLGAQLNMQGQLANQSTGLQSALANQQAQEFQAGQTMQAGLANQQANLAAAQATAGYNMQGQLANQATGLQAGLAAQQMGLQGAEFNAGMGMTAEQSNQAAAMQALAQQYQGGLQSALQTQQLGLQGQMASGQLGLQGTQLNIANLAQQGALQQNAGALNLAGYNAGLAGLAAQGTAAGQQQGYEQSILDTQYQNQWNNVNLPMQALNFQAGVMAQNPSWGTTTTADTYQQGQVNQPTFNLGQLAGGIIAGGAQVGAAAAGARKGGLLSIHEDGTPRFDTGGIANALEAGAERPSQFRRRLYSPLRIRKHHNYPAARKSPQRFLDQVLAPQSTGLGLAYAAKGGPIRFDDGGALDDGDDNNDLASHQLPISGPSYSIPIDSPEMARKRQQEEQDRANAPFLVKAFRALASDPNNMVLGPSAISVLPETVPLFAKAMSGAEQVTGDRTIDQALAFLKTRYPRFSAQAPVTADDLGFLAKAAYNYKNSPPNISLDSQYATNLPETIESLAHEMTHARQANQGGIEALLKEAQAGVPYEDRQIESFARQGGGTARATYQKYLDLLGQLDPTASDQHYATQQAIYAEKWRQIEAARAAERAARWNRAIGRVTPGGLPKSQGGLMSAYNA